jgi:HPt (histidine-containing phosphotransfer) domain-containing protein
MINALLKWMPDRTIQRMDSNLPTKGAALDDSYVPDELPPFDVRALVKRTNGKPKLVRKMMRSFCNEFAHAGTDLRQLIDEGKREEAGRLAHTLKGVARTLEACALGDAAFAVENGIRLSDEPDLEPLIESMERMLAPAIIAAASLDANVVIEEGAGPFPERIVG